MESQSCLEIPQETDGAPGFANTGSGRRDGIDPSQCDFFGSMAKLTLYNRVLRGPEMIGFNSLSRGPAAGRDLLAPLLATLLISACAVESPNVLPPDIVGQYSGIFTPTTLRAEDGGICIGGSGIMTISRDGTMSATATTSDGQVFTITGRVDQANQITGRISVSDTVTGTISGSVGGGIVRTTFEGAGGCRGTGLAEKI